MPAKRHWTGPGNLPGASVSPRPPHQLGRAGAASQTSAVDIVVFLEARIAEEESSLEHTSLDDSPTLTRHVLAESAQKRAILADWTRAAAAEGISNPADARGPLTQARRSMLLILAAAYRGHPDHSAAWLR